MSFRFIRSMILILLLSMTIAVSRSDAAGIGETIRNVGSAIGNAPKELFSSFHGLGQGSGTGFYQAIYQSVISNPNRLVEERIKEKFGINFAVDFGMPKYQGSAIFTDFFKFSVSDLLKTIERKEPSMQSSLISACKLFKAAQLDDELQRWEIMKKRIKDKSAEAKEQVKRIDQKKQKQENERQKFSSLDASSETGELLQCYSELSNAVDFEIKLQTILHPSRKQLEALQTFTNDRLDDFTKHIGPLDINYGFSFPRYDLLIDLKALDTILFGAVFSAGTTGTGTSDRADYRDQKRYKDFRDLKQDLNKAPVTIVPSPTVPIENLIPGLGSLSQENFPSGGKTEPSSDIMAEPSTVSQDSLKSTARPYGTSWGSQYAGPFCPAELGDGIKLNYDYIGKAPGVSKPLSKSFFEDIEQEKLTQGQEPPTAPEPPSKEHITPPIEFTPPSGIKMVPPDQVEQLLINDSPSRPGTYRFGKNRKAICDGTTSFTLGNEFLDFLACIDIRLAKIGKTWENVIDDKCLSCQIAKMNALFEEEIFKQSIRPHKNTATIMESGLCEGAYSADILQLINIEVVPTKFYSDICYPDSGVTPKEYGEIVGYPEIIQKVNTPGMTVICKGDFTDEKAISRCKEVLQKDQLSYEEYRKDYLVSIGDPVQKTHVWSRLAGARGIAKRDLHRLLYRLGKDEPWLKEDEDAKYGKRDFQDRLDKLKKQAEEINKNEKWNDGEKARELICLKGYFFGTDQQTACQPYDDTFKKLNQDVEAERIKVQTNLKNWNKRSKDFNRENNCTPFSRQNYLDMIQNAWSNKGSILTDFFLETNTRKIQSEKEQVTESIAGNFGVEDLGQFFGQLDETVESLSQGKREELIRQQVRDSQQLALQFLSLREEFQALYTNTIGLANAWGRMFDKQWVGKSGKKINILESLKEKF